jgi:hypothetical protein
VEYTSVYITVPKNARCTQPGNVKKAAHHSGSRTGESRWRSSVPRMMRSARAKCCWQIRPFSTPSTACSLPGGGAAFPTGPALSVTSCRPRKTGMEPIPPLLLLQPARLVNALAVLFLTKENGKSRLRTYYLIDSGIPRRPVLFTTSRRNATFRNFPGSYRNAV